MRELSAHPEKMRRNDKLCFKGETQPMRANRLFMSTALTALLCAAPVWAQDSGEDAEDEVNYLDRVVVSGTINPRTQLDSAVSVSTVDNQLIEDFNPSSEADLWRLIPGIQVPGGGGPGGNSNVAVRGLPVITGGSPYVAIQEDGLQVSLFGDDAFANNDLWTRYDWTTRRIEAIRGGTAGTFTSQAPGAVLNYISRTGEEQGGAIGVTSGIGFDETQVDFRYGDYLTDDIRFHVGGFIRQGEGHKDVGYQIIDSFQLKGNLTKELDGGYLRFHTKIADTQEPIYHNSPFLANLGSGAEQSISDMTPFSGAGQSFDPRDESFHNINQRTVAFLPLGSDGDVVQREINGVSTEQLSFGIDFMKDLNDTFTLRNNGRIQRVSGSFANSWGNAGYGVADGTDVLRYATGANVGGNVPAGTVFQNQQTVIVDTDDYGSFINDLSLAGKWDVGGAQVSAKVGYFYFSQSVEQAWHVNNHTRVVDGSNADLLNQFDTAGNQLTVDGANGFNQGWGGFPPVYDYDITNQAPYVALDVETDRFVFDVSLRNDTVATQGERRGTATNAFTVTINDPVTGNAVDLLAGDLGGGSLQRVDFETDKTNWTVGALWKATDNTSVFVRASEAFRHNSYRRFNNASEFTANGDITSVARDAFTDPVEQLEIGVKNRGAVGEFDYTVDFTLLQAEFTQNAVETNPVICGPINGGPSCLIPTTIESQGFEFFGTANWNDLSVVANATYTDAEDTDGNRIVRVPDFQYTLNARYDFLDNLSANVGLSGQTDTLIGNLVEDGSIIFNGGVSYSPIEGITLGLDAYNLTDELVFRGNDVSVAIDAATLGRADGKALLTGIPVDGRTVRLSLRYDF